MQCQVFQANIVTLVGFSCCVGVSCANRLPELTACVFVLLQNKILECPREGQRGHITG